MPRSRVIATALLASVALALSAGVAGAQDYPGTTAPAVCSATVTANAPMLASATVTITVSCPTLPNGINVNGVLNSTPVALPTATVANNAASFRVTLPSDWETRATHSVTLKNADTGQLLASSRFYVDGKGIITAAPSTSATTIARTGASNNTGTYAKSGVVLLALGAGAVGISRRRRVTAPAA